MATKQKSRVPVFGVIVSGVTKEEAIERYVDALAGNSVSLYTSNSSNLGILSESGTLLYNPITASADMEESEDGVQNMLESYSSADDESVQAYYSVCSNGCGAHVVASDNFITQFCPVCASELDDLEDDDGNGIDDDLEDFDTSYSANADDDDNESESSVDEFDFESDSSELSDDEIMEYSAIAGISISGNNMDYASLEDEEDTEHLEDDESEDEPEEEFESDSSELSDDEIMEYSAIAGISISGDDEDEEESEEDDGESDDSEYDSDGLDEGDFELNEPEEVETEDTNASESSLIAVASSKDEAITSYAEMCVSGAVTKHTASVSGSVFYSASNADVEIAFDPMYGDPNIESKDVIISTSSYSGVDEVPAHYFVCSSSDCGAHIVSSTDEIVHCPSCSADIEEPSYEEAPEENSNSEDEEDDNLDFNVIDEEEGEGEEGESESCNEKALARVLSFVAGAQDVVPAKLNIAYCGAVDGLKSWVAFYNGQPVAKATSQSAEKHKTIFEEPAYANAVMAGAQELGISKILDEMGFEASMSSVAISDSLKKNILNKHFKDKMRAMSSQLENEVSSKNVEYKERFAAALSTAAVGINRGFFKGFNNPVKTSLVSALAAAGVRQPEVLIDGVFKAHADDYHKALFEKANDLMNTSLETQNEIAQAVDGSNYMESSTSSVASDSVEGRLSNLGQHTQTSQVTQQQSTSSNAAVDMTKLKTVVSGLGKR